MVLTVLTRIFCRCFFNLQCPSRRLAIVQRWFPLSCSSCLVFYFDGPRIKFFPRTCLIIFFQSLRSSPTEVLLGLPSLHTIKVFTFFWLWKTSQTIYNLDCVVDPEFLRKYTRKPLQFKRWMIEMLSSRFYDMEPRNIFLVQNIF